MCTEFPIRLLKQDRFQRWYLEVCNCMLLYKLNRKNLEKLYLIYIRPIFEYACEVWDNCGVSNSCKLERLQLEAARIITGLPIFTNTEYLYRETGWERLEERRTRRKLQLLYNIQNGSTPPYLLDLILIGYLLTLISIQSYWQKEVIS